MESDQLRRVLLLQILNCIDSKSGDEIARRQSEWLRRDHILRRTAPRL